MNVTMMVYRKDCELTGKELSANTIASMLVAQQVSGVPDLNAEMPMSRDLILFLNRERAIKYWLENGWIRSTGDSLFLTNDGLEEIELREANEAIGASGRKKPGNVTPMLIQKARQFILTGAPDDEGTIIAMEIQF